MEEELTQQPEGATPLGPDDMQGLIPAHIRTRGELDEWENQNVLKARNWAMSRRRNVLDDKFMRSLHRWMFDDTWRWAGQYRHDERNIGIDPKQVPEAVRNLCEDAKARLGAEENARDTAVWFHHRLTQIHPFANGNGRHARLVTDLLLIGLGQAPFAWGRSDLVHKSNIRNRYISALRDADKGDLESLKKFVQSGAEK
ncbi:MAG: mobile mystery protein B [Gammaproteobacteria bacterium]|nr:mobile mystery protein B [Gammaproteobacteria bacterium]